MVYIRRTTASPSTLPSPSREVRDLISDLSNTTLAPPINNVTVEDLLDTTMSSPLSTTELAITNSTDAGAYYHLEVLRASFSMVLAQLDLVRREITAYQEQSELAAGQLRLELLLAVCLTGAVLLLACYSKRLCNIVGRCSRHCGGMCIASTRDDEAKKLASSEEMETFVYYNLNGEAVQFTQEDIKREVHRQALKNLRAQFDPGHKEFTGSVNSGFTGDGSNRPNARKPNKEGSISEGAPPPTATTTATATAEDSNA